MNGTGDDGRTQKTIKCKAKLYRISNMQRCPYIHEMKERLLGEQIPMEPLPKKIPEPPPFIMDQQQLLQQQPVATVVKLNADGYGSHTSPTHHRTERAPLMPREYDEDDDHYVDTSKYPKNAKTSLFIIMSFVYAKLLIVVCVAYVLSDVITKHSIPAYYYEGFFTYLYGMSILFLLYVFCFLLQESTCCSGEKPAKVKKPKEKEKEKKAKEKEEKEKKKKEEKEKKKEEKEKKEKEKKEKDKDKDKKSKKQEKSTYRRNSQGVVDEGLAAVPVPVAEIGARSDAPVVSQEQTPASTVDVEIGTISRGKKRKTTQNDQSHGSFFLRIGAIAFGLGTMIYNGLEFGAFFEIPFGSECYMILRGINPVLQMVFTFMQMYFIFMNSRLNIHRFKVIARFGLMHVVATNICVWIRTLVLEYIKEITHYHHKSFNVSYPDGPKFISDSVKYHVLGKPITTPSTTVASTTPNAFNYMKHIVNTTPSTQVPMLHSNPGIRRFISTTSTTAQSFTTKFWQALKSTTTTTTAAPRYYNQNPTTTRAWKPASTPFTSFRNSFLENGRNVHFLQSHVPNVADEFANHINGTEFLEDMFKQPWTALNVSVNNTEVDLFTNCTRVNIMGNIVQDSAPYLFPFIIEYSLIGAAVIYVMWKHIGRNPKYIKEEEVERRLEQMLCRRAVAMAHAQHGRVDCVGASKGLFFGLLMLVGSLICLILFFVLIHHRELGLLAIYLADVSHCVLMALSIIAIIVGFIRVQSLKFKTEEQSDLNDILLRVSAFGLFTYAVFSVIAGSLNAFTSEPNRLVMITGILSIVQVVLQLLFIADVSRRRVHLPEHDRSKPGRQVVTFLLICNVTMWIIYTFETQKVEANPVQLDFYGFVAWAIVQRFTLPLCIFHRFHSAVTLAEIWKTSYKARLE